MYSTPHRIPSNKDNHNTFLSCFTAATESMLLRIQSCWVVLLVCCWESAASRFEGTTVRRNDSDHSTNNSEDLHSQNNTVTPCKLASMLLHDTTCSQQKFQNRCFSLEDKTLRIYSIWPIDPTDTILYSYGLYQRQSDDEFDFQNTGAHFSKLRKKNPYFKMHSYNLACCFAWVWNLVAHIEGGT
jgi:hypothetical protein